MLVALAFLTLFIIFGIRLNKDQSKNFSFYNTFSIRGGCCLFVILVHIINTTLLQSPLLTNSETWHNFALIVSEGVIACFYVLSGYSLTTQYKKHGVRYLKKMLFFKIPKMLFILFITNTLYFLIFHLNDGYSAQDIAIKILSLDWSSHKLNSTAWYFTPMLVFYFSFASILLIFHKHEKIGFWIIGIIPLIWIGVVGLAVYFSGNDNYWVYIRSAQCFSIGILYGVMKNKFDKFAIEYGKYFVILAIFLFIISLKFFLYVIEASVLAVCLIYISILFINQNKILNYFGKISLWIYLVHKIYILLFAFMASRSQELYALTIYSCAIGSGIVLYYFEQGITLCIRKIFRLNKNTQKVNKSI